MVDEMQARAIAEQYLQHHILPGSPHDLVVADVMEFTTCWVVTVNTRQYAETRDFKHGLVGLGPIIINRTTGAVRQGVTAEPLEAQLDQE
jgi:hypothetical protein